MKAKRQATPRVAMLNVHRLGSFKYDLRDALGSARIDEATASSILANVIAKASRISIKDAKDYIRELEEKSTLEKGAAEDICSVLDRYSKYR